MIYIMDKIILFISTILIILTLSITTINIIPILICIVFACLLTYFDNKYIQVIGIIIYSMLCFFISDLIFFLPLICYEMSLSKYQQILIIPFITIFLTFNTFTEIFVISLLYFFSFVIKYKTNGEISQKSNYIQYRDKMKELSIELEQKNNELLEKQEYEINIATLNERSRISMEIHDNVGHLLSSAILQVGAIISINSDDKIRDNLIVTNNTLSSAMDAIRKSVHNIHDETLKLEPQIRSIINQFSYCNINLDYNISDNPNTKISYAIITTVKESLSNVIRHSNASNVNIMIREHPSLYQLIIHDNGNTNSTSALDGIGIKNMENRIYELNGIINISNNDGFRIFISIPKEGKNNENYNC